jgi:hypothetical protein
MEKKMSLSNKTERTKLRMRKLYLFDAGTPHRAIRTTRALNSKPGTVCIPKPGKLGWKRFGMSFGRQNGIGCFNGVHAAF